MWESGNNKWGPEQDTPPGPTGKKRPYPSSAPGGYMDPSYMPPPPSMPKMDYDDDFGYGGPYQTGMSDMKVEPPSDVFASMGLPTSFVCSGNGQDDFAEDVPLERKPHRGRGGKQRGAYSQHQSNQYSGGGGGFDPYMDYGYDYGSGGGYSDEYGYEDEYNDVYGGGRGSRGGRGRGQRGGQGRGGRGNRGGQDRGGGRGGGGRGFGRGAQGGRGGQGRGGGVGGDRGRGNRGGGGVGGRGGGQNRGRGDQNRGGMLRGAGNMQRKPGMAPQAQFGGQRGGKNKRGARGGGGGAMAPVHSLSTVATQPFDANSMSSAEKIHRFALYVQGEPMKINSIQTIENALTGSKLNIKTNYEVEELMRVSGKWMFTGCLSLNGTFLARAVGANKKEVKHETYSKALEVLKTKTVAEIFALVDPGADAIRKELTSTLDTNKDVEKQAENILEKQATKAAQIMSSQDGFQYLIEYLLQCLTLPENRISAIEQAMTGSKCGLSHNYDFKAARLPSGRFFFHGRLTIGDIIVALGKGYRKKDCKVDTYEMAFTALTTKPLQEILQGVEEEPEEQQEQMLKGADAKVVPPEIKRLSLAEKMDKLIQTLKDSVYRDNNINTIDVAASGLSLIKTCIYRKLDTGEEGSKTNIICDFYLDNVLISSGEGERRKEAQIDAYSIAWETLCQTTGERVAKDHKRLTPEDSNDPTVIDVFVKGQGKPHGDSNMSGLKRNNLDFTDPHKTVESLVLIEHEDWSMDRRRQAFCILIHSATQNGMLLKWNIESVDSFFKCCIQLQNQDIGEAVASSKNNARSLAAAAALFKLYETQDVIKVVRKDDSKLWIPYENIWNKAESLRTQSGEPPVPDTSEGVDEEGKPLPRPTNKWVVQVADSIVKEYKDQFTLDELIFGPGIPLQEGKEIRNLAKTYDLKHDVRQLNGELYTIMHTKMSPQNMADCLKRQGGESGKFVLVDRSTLPSQDDIKEELEKQLSARGPHTGLKSSFTPRPKQEGFQPKFLQE